MIMEPECEIREKLWRANMQEGTMEQDIAQDLKDILIMAESVQKSKHSLCDSMGRTPWHHLLELSKRDFLDKTRRDMVYYAAIRLIQTLGSQGLMEPTDLHTSLLPLHKAASTNNFRMIELLLEACPEAAGLQTKITYFANGQKIGMKFPFHIACSEGGAGRHCVNILQMLHKAFPMSVNRRDVNGQLPLSMLCRQTALNSTSRLMASQTDSWERKQARRSYEESLRFVFAKFTDAICLADFSYGETCFHHILDAVVQRQLYFPLYVWREMVCHCPKALFQCDKHLRISPLVIWIKSLVNNSDDNYNLGDKLVHIAVECLLDMHPILSKSFLNNRLPISHIITYVAAAFGTEHTELFRRAMTHTLQMSIDNSLHETHSNMILHMFCYGLKWWYCEPSYTFSLKLAKARLSMLNCVLSLVPQSIKEYDPQGCIPLHLALLHENTINDSGCAHMCVKPYWGKIGDTKLLKPAFWMIYEILNAYPEGAAVSIVRSHRSCKLSQYHGLFPFMLVGLKRMESDTRKETYYDDFEHNSASVNLSFILLLKFVSIRNITDL